MPKKLTFDPAAKSEMHDAALYDEEVRPGLGEPFIKEVEVALQRRAWGR